MIGLFPHGVAEAGAVPGMGVSWVNLVPNNRSDRLLLLLLLLATEDRDTVDKSRYGHLWPAAVSRL